MDTNIPPSSPPDASAPAIPAGLSVALYLRSDGSLCLANAEAAVEFPLTAAQLLQLGIDALRVAVALQPDCLAAAAQAMENTIVTEGRPCLN